MEGAHPRGHSPAADTVSGRHDEVRGHQGAAAEVASSPLQGHHEGPRVGPGLLAAHDLRGQRGAWAQRESGLAHAAGGPRLRAVRPRAPTGQGPSRACRPMRKLRHKAWPSSVQLWTPGPKAWAPPPEASLPIPLITAPREDEGAVRFRVQWGGGNRHPGTDGQTCGPTHRPAARSAGCKPGRGWRLHSVGPWPREAGVRSVPTRPSYGFARGAVALPHFLPTPKTRALIGRVAGGGAQGARVGST